MAKREVFTAYGTEATKRRALAMAAARGMSQSELIVDLIDNAQSDDAPCANIGAALTAVRNRFYNAAPQERGEALRGSMALWRESEQVLIRALQHEITTDSAGLVPVAQEQSILKAVGPIRPAVVASNRGQGPKGLMEAVGRPTMAGVKSFQRPRVTQRTQADVQTNEGDLLASQKFLVAGDTVSVHSRGGTVSLSEQEADWTEPAGYDAIVADLAISYAESTGAALTADVETAATTTVPLPAGGTAEQWLTQLVLAQASVRTTSKLPGDTLYVGSTRHDQLTALTDANGSPVLAALLDQLRLQLVWDPAFSTGFVAVANSLHVETWEQERGIVQVVAPNTLELLVAVRGYFATHVRAEGLCALV